MRVALAQTRPIKGDFLGNIEQHERFVNTAVSHHTDLIIFPELSLTGYEPALAKQLATHPDDGRLAPLQTLSDAHQITIGVGLPTKSDGGICIGLVLIRPFAPRQTYAKKHLFPDEEPYFVSGENLPALTMKDTAVALAICYELSVVGHAEQAFLAGADLYLASVAKSARGVENASKRLSGLAQKHAKFAMLVNGVGPSDNFVSAGNSSIWNPQGHLIAQLDNTNEGMIIFDPQKQVLIEKMM